MKSPVVGARTVVVDKGTGEFWWAMTSVSGAQVVGPDMVGSQRATAYRFHQAAKIAGGLASSTGWVKLWVGSNGLPLKAESDGTAQVLGLFGGGKSKTTILYEDYGAPIRITAPAL